MRNPVIQMLSIEPQERLSPYFLINCPIRTSSDNKLYHTPATFMFPEYYNELYSILYRFHDTESMKERLSILSVFIYNFYYFIFYR